MSFTLGLNGQTRVFRHADGWWSHPLWFGGAPKQHRTRVGAAAALLSNAQMIVLAAQREVALAEKNPDPDMFRPQTLRGCEELAEVSTPTDYESD